MSEVSYSACPACSIVLAKFRAARLVNEAIRDLRIRQTLDAPDHALHDGGCLVARAQAWLFHLPPQVSRLNWQGRIIVLAVFGLWTLWLQKARLSDAVYAGMDQER